MPDKSPFNDEVDTSFTDPSNLFTGAGSQMFKNERLADENKKANKLKEERARQGSQLLPIAKDLLAILTKLEAENRDIGGYLDDIYAKNGKPKVIEKDVEIEFRARQMNLKTIQEIRGWINNRLRQEV